MDVRLCRWRRLVDPVDRSGRLWFAALRKFSGFFGDCGGRCLGGQSCADKWRSDCGSPGVSSFSF